MKKVIFILAFAISITSCSQNKDQQSTTNSKKNMYDINQFIFPEAKEITQANFVEKLDSQIKHYDNEPVYYFRINKQNCLIEIYVNDISIYDDYKLSNLITPIEIGNILKSGSQKVTVKMYPVGNLNNETLGVKDVSPVTKITEGAQVMISVINIDEKSTKGLDDEKVITQKVSPKEVAGKEYYEFNFTFDAKVPYEFEGWTKGQNLKKLDQELVRKKALEFYNMVGQIHINKDLDAWLKLYFPSNIRNMSFIYADRKYLNDLLSELKQDVTGNDYTISPIKDYKMEYMGDGRLVRLMTNSQDPDLRNGGALFLKYGEGGISVPGITLYLPEGRNLATQGFMMWK